MVNDDVSVLVAVTELVMESDGGKVRRGRVCGKPSYFCISVQFVVKDYFIIDILTSTLKSITGNQTPSLLAVLSCPSWKGS